jgi:hypothetical protein
MDQLIVAYPDAVINGDNITIEVDSGIFVMCNLNIESYEYNSWDLKGNDLTQKVKQAINYINLVPYTKENKLVLILQYVRDSFRRIAGFNTKIIEENDVDFPEYDVTTDLIWQQLAKKFSVSTERKLHIITYGTIFILDTPKQCQKVFNSAILRGSYANTPEKFSLAYKSLLKLRGTSKKVQWEVRGAELFKSFMEEVVKSIEKNNLTTIGIVCRAGYHRSVSCAEMLIHLYPNRTVKHLTLNN